MSENKHQMVNSPWEIIDPDPYDFTSRLRVPSGWLYRNVFLVENPATREDSWFTNIVFVPAVPPQ